MGHLDAVVRNETPPVGLWIDTSALTPDETVDDILRRSHEARVE